MYNCHLQFLFRLVSCFQRNKKFLDLNESCDFDILLLSLPPPRPCWFNLHQNAILYQRGAETAPFNLVC